jgi:hypothetical protein
MMVVNDVSCLRNPQITFKKKRVENCQQIEKLRRATDDGLFRPVLVVRLCNIELSSIRIVVNSIAWDRSGLSVYI